MKIKVLQVEFWYSSTKVLEGIEFTVDEGEFVSIIGPNGAGKTTLLKIIARLLRPRKGVVYVDGVELWKLKPREVAKRIAYAETSISTGFQLTVLDYVLTARYPYTSLTSLWEREEDVRIAEEALRELGVEHLANRRLDQLSSGELQRVILARIIAQQPRILLIDEPTAFLDIKHRLEVMELLKNLVRRKNIAAITAIHDLELAARYSDKIILLCNGRIVVAGKPEQVLTPENIEKTYGVKVEVVKHPRHGLIVIPLGPLSGNQGLY